MFVGMALWPTGGSAALQALAGLCHAGQTITDLQAQRTGLDKWLANSGLPAKVSPAAEAALRLAPPSARRPAGQ